jgi:hypothetical protein
MANIRISKKNREAIRSAINSLEVSALMVAEAVKSDNAYSKCLWELSALDADLVLSEFDLSIHDSALIAEWIESKKAILDILRVEANKSDAA